MGRPGCMNRLAWGIAYKSSNPDIGRVFAERGVGIGYKFGGYMKKENEVLLPYLEMKSRAESAEASLAELRKRIEALTGYWKHIEERSEEAHAVYQKEAHRRGDVRHDDDYAKLSESTKEWDRVLVRWMNDRVRLFLLPEPAADTAKPSPETKP